MQGTSYTTEEAQAFCENGFVVLPGALSSAEVGALNTAIDHDMATVADAWPGKGEQGRVQTTTTMLRSPAFDRLIDHHSVLPLLIELMGPTLAIEEFSIMIRAPLNEDPEPPAWHRDFGRDESCPLGMRALSLVYYLRDVTEGDHCFCAVARTHDSDREVAAGDHDPANERDLRGPAGTALMFHTSCVHAGRLKRGAGERRTIHLYYGYSDQPICSGHSNIPARLRGSMDPSLPEGFTCRADKV